MVIIFCLCERCRQCKTSYNEIVRISKTSLLLSSTTVVRLELSPKYFLQHLHLSTKRGEKHSGLFREDIKTDTESCALARSMLERSGGESAFLPHSSFYTSLAFL